MAHSTVGGGRAGGVRIWGAGTSGWVTGDPGASCEYDAFVRGVRAWGVNQAVENSAFGLPASGRWADLQVFRCGSRLRDGDRGAAAVTVGFRIGSGAGYRVGKP